MPGVGAEQVREVFAEVTVGEAVWEQSEQAEYGQQGVGSTVAQAEAGDAGAGVGGGGLGDRGQGGGAVGGVVADGLDVQETSVGLEARPRKPLPSLHG